MRVHVAFEDRAERRLIKRLARRDPAAVRELYALHGRTTFGFLLRLLGDRAAEYLPTVDAALREGFAEFQREDGSIWGTTSTWIVTGTAP